MSTEIRHSACETLQMLRLKEGHFQKKVIRLSRSCQLSREWAPINSGFQCVTSVWSSIVIRRVSLRLEFVDKRHKAVILLDN